MVKAQLSTPSKAPSTFPRVGKRWTGAVIAAGMMTLAIASPRADPYTPSITDPTTQPWRWTTYPELQDKKIRCMAERADGAMCFGTASEILIHDGWDWAELAAPFPVNVLVGHTDGDLYLGTDAGLLTLPDNSRPGSMDLGPSRPLPWFIESMIEARDGSIWAGSPWGALRVQGADRRLYTTQPIADVLRSVDPETAAILLPEDGSTIVPLPSAAATSWGGGFGFLVAEASWTGTHRDGEAARVSPTVIQVAKDGPAARLLKPGDRILDVEAGANWFELNPHFVSEYPSDMASRRIGGMLRLEIERNNTRSFVSIRADPDIPGSIGWFPVHDIHEDRHGAIWFGLRTGEVVKFDASGDGPDWIRHDESTGLTPGFNALIGESGGGYLWAIVHRDPAAQPRGDPGLVAIHRFASGSDAAGRSWIAVDPGTDLQCTRVTGRANGSDGAMWLTGVARTSAGHWIDCAYLVCRGSDWTAFSARDLGAPNRNVCLAGTRLGQRIWFAGHEQPAVFLDLSARWVEYDGLLFQFEARDGTWWFIEKQGRAVRRLEDGSWHVSSENCGLMDRPSLLFEARNGEIWAVGSHSGSAAYALRRGDRWVTETISSLPEIDPLQVFEEPTGAVWLGVDSVVDHEPGKPRPGGFVSVASTGEIPLGHSVYPNARKPWFDFTVPDGIGAVRWVGTGLTGRFSPYNGARIQPDLGMARLSPVRTRFFRTARNDTWAVQNRQTFRHDGRSWVGPLFESHFNAHEAGDMRQTNSGLIWFNRYPPIWPDSNRVYRSPRIRTMGYRPESNPPTVASLSVPAEATEDGNIRIHWMGRERWKESPVEELQYSYRIDNGPWSPFSMDASVSLALVRSGAHTVSIRARDRDFNIGPPSLEAAFSVPAPMWRRPAVLALGSALVAALIVQTYRAERHRRALVSANESLEERVRVRTGDLEISNELLRDEIRARELAEKERSRFENDLRHAQKMETIGVLAGGIAHDFNNILQPILVNSELAMDSLQDQPEVREDLESIQKLALRAKELVRQILTFSRKGDQNRCLVDLGDITLETVQLARSSISKSIAIRTQVSPGQHSVLADPTQIQQIVMNLLSNAVNALGSEEGFVRVSVSNLEVTVKESPDRIKAVPGHYAVLSVQDTGQGMTADTRKQIFDPFFTTNPIGKGTGLGLSVVHGVVVSHDGYIDVESAVGVGTDVTVYLPSAASEPDRDTAASGAAAPGSDQRGRILFVDDEEDTLLMARRLLERRGHSGVFLKSSREALAYFLEHADAIDLVMIDRDMPELPGDKLAIEIKARRPSIPIVLITGYAGASPSTAVAGDIELILEKPVHASEIYTTIERFLPRPDAETNRS